jgi:hypothetical protein
MAENSCAISRIDSRRWRADVELVEEAAKVAPDRPAPVLPVNQ